MPNQIDVRLKDVEETLLIPLYARAEETRKNGLIQDIKAVEIVDHLKYDFDKMKNKPSLKGAVFRTLTYDILLKEILSENPEATVVELGCGLNTRYHRIDNKNLLWFDLDMPSVYELWSVFFEEGSTRKFLPYSAFDPQWVTSVKKEGNPPYIFISEASTIYFDETENKKLFSLLSTHFPGCYYIFDTATEYFIERQDKHDTLKLFDARIKWCMNDPKEIENWNGHNKLIKVVNFFTKPPKELRGKIPWFYKAIFKFMSLINKKMTNQYLLNVFKIN